MELNLQGLWLNVRAHFANETFDLVLVYRLLGLVPGPEDVLRVARACVASNTFNGFMSYVSQIAHKP